MESNSSETKPELVGRLETELIRLLDRLLMPPETLFGVGLSGGPDSCALLSLLSRSEKLRQQVVALHVNHGLRGKESDGDEAFCAELCSKLGFRFLSAAISPPDKKEETLRTLRYDKLGQMCAGADIEICLTAHTHDDQVETILFRMFRGTSPAGIRGILPVLKADEDFWILRPLLGTRKSELLAYLESENITPRQDESNNDTTYRRNYIRHELVPRIEEQFSDFGARLVHLAQMVETDDSELSRQASLARQIITSGGSLKIARLLEFSDALQRRVIAQELTAREIEISFERVEEILAMAGKEKARVSLDANFDLLVERKKLSFLDKRDAEVLASLSTEISVPGTTLVPELNLAVSVRPMTGELETYPTSDEWSAAVDITRMKGPFFLRHRQAGDTIQPLGMDRGVRLKKYLHTHKSDTMLKMGNTAIVLADDTEVLWVPGVGLSQRIACNGQPTHMIYITRLAADSAGMA